MGKFIVIKKTFVFLIGLLGSLGVGLFQRGYILPKQSFCFKNKPYTTNSIGCYVINLDRSPGRIKAISILLAQLNLPVHRVIAVDGKKNPEILQDPQLVDLHTYAHLLKGKRPGSGEAACYLSHVKALKTFLESSYEFGFIFEDDVSFDPEVLQGILPGLTQKKELWDVCSLQLNRQQKGGPLKITSLGSYELCFYRIQTWCAGAYLVNRAAAHSLVHKAFPMKLPWDLYYLRFWEFKGQNERMLRFTGIEPRLVHQTYGDSEIENSDQRYKTDKQATYWSWIRLKGRLFTLSTNILHYCWTWWVYLTSEKK
ncbi:MAG: hypothetical protein BGO07_03155 [Alphaproteobacteria bacterium 40-19]|nr:MAG: hypothetical protein BGO07_03155 [Alphaproteobacteria bacterium 40-19]